MAPATLVGGLAGRGFVEATDVHGATVRVPTREIERINVVVDRGDLKLVMGRSSWRTDEDAVAAVRALGHPWIQLEARKIASDDPNAPIKRSYGRSFVVRAPAETHAALVSQLNAAAGVTEDTADPKKGAIGVRHRSTYAVQPAALRASDAGVSLDMTGITTPPGYVVRGDVLVPAALDAGGRLTIPRAQIVRMEAEARLSIDGDGTIVLVGQNPSEARRGALLFGIVALVGLLNMAAVAVFVRRRRRMAAGETA